MAVHYGSSGSKKSASPSSSKNTGSSSINNQPIANPSVSSLYNRNDIVSKQRQYQKELNITPSQALNMAMYGKTSNSTGLDGGMVYDPTQKRNIQVSGAELRNMQAAQKALKQQGYTPYQAVDMSYSYKNNNPMTAMNSKNNRIVLNTPKTPTVTAPITTPTATSIVDRYATNPYTNTGSEGIEYGYDPLTPNQIVTKSMKAGSGAYVLGKAEDDEENNPMRGGLKDI